MCRAVFMTLGIPGPGAPLVSPHDLLQFLDRHHGGRGSADPPRASPDPGICGKAGAIVIILPGSSLIFHVSTTVMEHNTPLPDGLGNF